MSLYSEYIKEIQNRKEELGLAPKPIDSADLLSEIIAQIKDQTNEHREDSLNFFIYNTLPGTTSAAGVKAKFLKEIILGQETVAEISAEFQLVVSNCFSRDSQLKLKETKDESILNQDFR